MVNDSPSAPLDIIATSLRRERARAGVSLTELAKRAGVAKSTLSQLESGSGNPSVETLWALGMALGIPFSRLVDPPQPQIKVIRSGKAPVVRSENSPFAAAMLSSCPPGARRDLHLLQVETGGARRASAHLPGTVEHVVVTSGRLRVGPGDSPIELDVGDYLAFAADTAHSYEALVPDTKAVLVMEYN